MSLRMFSLGAIDEGPASVEALHELLSFKESWFTNDETRGSTHQDRLGVRLALIQQIADGLERNPKFSSVQSLALDIDRISNKTRLAQAPGQVRTIYAKSDELRALALERGMDPDRISTKLFEKMVAEGPQCEGISCIFALRQCMACGSNSGDRGGRTHARASHVDGCARWLCRGESGYSY